MGAESSIFKKCKIDHEPIYVCKQWSLYDCSNGKHKLSLFMCHNNENTSQFDVTHWKKIRHPYIVKYYDCGVFRGKHCVVTEKVEPLRMVMDKLSDDVRVSGLANIAEALSFLHDTCLNSHNNVSLDSIFVSKSESLCWKLGSLLCVSHVGQESRLFLSNLSKLHTQLSTSTQMPPEDLINNEMEMITHENEVHRRDCYSFGLILSQLLIDVKLSDTLKLLRSESISQRPTMKTILSDDLFTQCQFLQIKSFLTNFASFNDQDRRALIDSLVDRLRLLSPNLVASHIIPLMMTSRAIISHPDINLKIIPYLLIPLNSPPDEQTVELKHYNSGETIKVDPLVSKSLFKTQVIPFICKLFYVRDVQLRLILLQYLPYYAPLISTSCFTRLFLPQILLGLKDSHDELVSLTFHSLSHLVTHFGAITVLGPRFKLFHTGIPKSAEESLDHVSDTSSLVLEEDDEERIRIMPERSSPDGREIDVVDNVHVDHKDNHEQHKKNKKGMQLNVNKKEVKKDEIEKLEPTSSVIIDKTKLSIDSQSKTTTNTKPSSLNRNTEFDIKALDFKQLESEVDFFTGMEPKPLFKQTKALALSEFGLQASTSTSNTSNNLLFAVNEDAVGINSGWEDEEWDVENE